MPSWVSVEHIIKGSGNQWIFFKIGLTNTLVLWIYFLIMKISNFRGGISEVSTTKAALVATRFITFGTWYRYGSWGVCFTYGMWFGCKALATMGWSVHTSDAQRRAADFLLSKQRSDGGWGESYLSSQDKVYSQLEGAFLTLFPSPCSSTGYGRLDVVFHLSCAPQTFHCQVCWTCW